MSYLGIDLGTSGLRALLLDEKRRVVGSAESAYEAVYPSPGWSEQDPQKWIDALNHVMGHLKSSHKEYASIQGIAVSGHMHGAVLMSKNGTVLRPCILWNDTRSAKQAEAMNANDKAREISGNIIFPGFTAPKLKWLEYNEPHVFNQVHKVLLPAAFLNFYLTGDYVIDCSDAAGTSWLDVQQRTWSNYLLELGGMTIEQMPRLVEGCEQAGILRSQLSEQWGLPKNVIIAGGAGDNAASACGVGALSAGDGFVSLGSSGVVMLARNAYETNIESAVHTFCHAMPNHWYQIGVMLSATDSLNWFSRLVGKQPSALVQDIGKDLKAPENIRFLPYLAGERTPHNDAIIRGSLTGLSSDTDSVNITKSILEGVAFGLRDSFDALNGKGSAHDGLIAVGGGTGSKYWIQLIATLFNVPLKLPKGGQFGAALGAARLAVIASKNGTPSDTILKPEISEIITPIATLSNAYEDAYQAFKTAYPAIKSIQ